MKYQHKTYQTIEVFILKESVVYGRLGTIKGTVTDTIVFFSGTVSYYGCEVYRPLKYRNGSFRTEQYMLQSTGRTLLTFLQWHCVMLVVNIRQQN